MDKNCYFELCVRDWEGYKGDTLGVFLPEDLEKAETLFAALRLSGRGCVHLERHWFEPGKIFSWFVILNKIPASRAMMDRIEIYDDDDILSYREQPYTSVWRMDVNMLESNKEIILKSGELWQLLKVEEILKEYNYDIEECLSDIRLK